MRAASDVLLKPYLLNQPLFLRTRWSSDLSMNESFQENESATYYDNDSDYGDDSCTKTEVIKFGAVVTPVFFTMVIVFSFVGNTLVLWVLIKYENLKSLTNAFLLNLAISDLVFTFGLPFWAADVLFGWTFGEGLCKSVSFIFYLGYYSSLIFLTVMTVHRYVAVVHPLSMLLNSTTRYSIWVSAFIWLVSFFAAAPHFIFSVVKFSFEKENFPLCHYNDPKWKLIGIYKQNSLFLVAFVTIAFCYIRILGRLLRPMSHTRPKTVKLILCIVLAFYLGWAPYNVALFLDSLIYWQVSPFNDCHVSTRVDYVFQVSRLVAFAHCCLNPVFYVFMGVKFRDHLKKVLKSFCKKDEQPHDRRQSQLIYSNGEEMSML